MPKVRERTVPQSVLVEYQQAQNSAEHHNTIIWIFTPVIFTLALWVLYVVFWPDFSSLPSAIKIMILFLGSLAIMYFSKIIESAHATKYYKYNICKYIERTYPDFIGQHNGLDMINIQTKDGKIIKVLRHIIYLFIVLFIAATLIILLNLSLDYWLICILAFIFGVYLIIVLIKFFEEYKDYIKLCEKLEKLDIKKVQKKTQQDRTIRD